MYRTIPLLLVTCLAGCLSDDVSTWKAFEGDAARAELLRHPHLYGHGVQEDVTLPASASDFYYAEGGTFNGMILYWSLKCDSTEDCWQVVAALGGPEQAKFEEWHPSEYSVVMDGPSFYESFHGEPSARWNVRMIENGFVHEVVQDGNERMKYWAIDSDRCMVFFHYESGGFPVDPAK